jgi:hypothetical protein
MDQIKKNLPLIIIGTVSVGIAGYIFIQAINKKSSSTKEPVVESPFIGFIDQRASEAEKKK